MRPFEYSAAADIADATRLVAASQNTRFIAGGTTLVDLMKLNVETPSRLVDINRLGARHAYMNEVAPLPDGGLRIGALVRNSDLAWSTVVKERYPVLSEALLAGASGQIRNMATVGGNLMQRTRCYYFRDTAMPCNKREPGSGCSAVEGHNRIHAVLGTSRQCIATSPGDMPVALAALDALVRVTGPPGERTIPVTDFHLQPGAHPGRDTVLRQGEMITAVDVPPLPWARRSHYRKVRDRASYAFALASAAVALDLDGTRIRDARVAFGGIATKPWRSREAEHALIGQTATTATFRAAAEEALRGAKAQSENGFKIELAKRTLVRALTTVAAMG
ncbi:MAG TPA: xanthine dehydrogenase family protein subunit M [Gemmatimonadaceae bacterium]|nr:xanthine dehydrogenase family protein subunit M [Gemmatimonadaceae bacterium]